MTVCHVRSANVEVHSMPDADTKHTVYTQKQPVWQVQSLLSLFHSLCHPFSFLHFPLFGSISVFSACFNSTQESIRCVAFSLFLTACFALSLSLFQIRLLREKCCDHLIDLRGRGILRFCVLSDKYPGLCDLILL